jgi:MFS family permease
MPRRQAFHRQILDHLRGVELPGGVVVERGAEAIGRRVEQGIDAVTEKVGGPARVRVVVLLAAVLALSSADTGAIGAIAPRLESSLGVGNVAIGLLVTVSGLTAAAGMLPVGWVTDRWDRTHLVAAAVVLWGLAEVLSALSPSYLFLLVVRLALGALTAVTGPTLASLTGDLFPARERSEIYGYILTGELIGAGFGLLVAGLVSSWTTWRVGLGVLSIPSFVVAWQLHKRLPEPARGGQSRLERGADEIVAAADLVVATDTGEETQASGHAAVAVPDEGHDEVVRQVRARRIDPREGVLLDEDPLELGWWESIRYVVAVRSNVTLIVASALGYFYFGGVETFALIYLEGHYGVGQGMATLIALAVGGAAIGGAIVGGLFTDTLLHHGRIEARLMVPAAAFFLAVLVFAPAVTSTVLALSLPLFLVAGFFISVPNPGLDAARLDVMPSRMWGRAEAVRSFLRAILQSFAPLVFGIVSTAFGGKYAGFGTSGAGLHAAAADASRRAAGLEQTFLVMLVALLAGAIIVWNGRKPYPVDVAAASETERRYPATTSPTVSPFNSRNGQSGSGTMSIAPQGHSVAHRPHPLQ